MNKRIDTLRSILKQYGVKGCRQHRSGTRPFFVGSQITLVKDQHGLLDALEFAGFKFSTASRNSANLGLLTQFSVY